MLSCLHFLKLGIKELWFFVVEKLQLNDVEIEIDQKSGKAGYGRGDLEPEMSLRGDLNDNFDVEFKNNFWRQNLDFKLKKKLFVELTVYALNF